MKTKTTRVQLQLPPYDHTALKMTSVQKKSTLSQEVEDTLVELMNGTLVIDDEKTFKPTAVNIDPTVAADFDEYCKKVGIAKNKLVRLAVAAKLRTGQDLLDGIDALAHKHRHSNSPRPSTLKDAA